MKKNRYKLSTVLLSLLTALFIFTFTSQSHSTPQDSGERHIIIPYRVCHEYTDALGTKWNILGNSLATALRPENVEDTNIIKILIGTGINPSINISLNEENEYIANMIRENRIGIYRQNAGHEFISRNKVLFPSFLNLFVVEDIMTRDLSDYILGILLGRSNFKIKY